MGLLPGQTLLWVLRWRQEVQYVPNRLRRVRRSPSSTGHRPDRCLFDSALTAQTANRHVALRAPEAAATRYRRAGTGL
jgi:hypothetical protein